MGTRGTGAVSRLLAAGIVGAVLGVSALAGRRNAPDPSHPGIRRWYRRLAKPRFTPPDAVFGAAWPALETGLAIGGYRLLRAPGTPARDTAIALWLANAAMIGGWTELFFARRELGTSAVASGAMVVTGVSYVAAAAKADPPAAALGMPFVGWLCFATVLAEQVWARNTSGGPGAE